MMKKNNTSNLIKILSLILVLTVCCILAVACDNDEPCENHVDANNDLVCDLCQAQLQPTNLEPTEEIVLNTTSVAMDVYEQLQLEIVSGQKGTATWTSLQPSVATVDANGIVSSIAEGGCEIKVTNENGSASCYITVENSFSAPVILLSTTKVQLSQNDEYVVSPTLRYKGEDVTSNANFEYLLVDGSANNILTMTQSGNNATFVGVDFGSTQYTVFVEYNGVQVSKVIDFAVKQMGVTFDAINMQPQKGGYLVKLSLLAVEGYITELLPEVNVVNDKTIVDGATITYTSQDTSIAKVESDGTFVPVSSGTTTVVGSYNGNSFNITVDVIKPTVAVVAQNSVVEVGRLSSIEFGDSLQGTFESAYIGDVSVGESIVDGKLNLSKTGLENMPISSFGEPVEITITTSLVEYVSNVQVYSLVIKNDADYQSIGPLSKAMYKDNDKMFGGYFILGNNVTVTSGMNEFVDRSTTSFAGDGSEGFAGVFDGNGYLMDGISRSGSKANAFISILHRDGIIKNIGFTNIVYGASQGSFLVHTGAGTVQDVYVQYKEINVSSSWSGTVMSPSITVERMVIDAYNTTISADAKGFSLITCSYGSFKIVDNSFAAILPEGYTFKTGNTYYNPDICNIAGNNTVLNSLAFYNWASIKDVNENVYNSMLTWSPFIWHLDEATGVMTFGKAQ